VPQPVPETKPKFKAKKKIVDPDEAYQVFNMGVGMVLFVEPPRVEALLAALAAAGESPRVIGRVESGTGRVRWA